MSTYLVTGGAGFIGSNLIGELVKRGETVRALDNLATGHIENLEQVKEKIQWHEADIRNLEIIRPDLVSFEGDGMTSAPHRCMSDFRNGFCS